MVALALDGRAAHVYRLLRAVLQAAQAADTVRADACPAIDYADIPARAEPCALAAADAAVCHGHLCGFLAREHRPCLCFEGVHGVRQRASAEVLDIENVVRDLRRRLLGARLCLLRIERGQHQIVRHEPYAGALVGYARPVIQRHDVMDLRHAHAGVTGIAHDAESVALGVDAQLGDKLLHIAGQAACVAREHEADTLCAAHVFHLRLCAHHNNVRVSKALCDVFCDVETVAAAGITEYNVFAHLYSSL